MKRIKKYRRGDIVWADLGQHPNSHLLSGMHPCLIVSTDKSRGSIYTVIPGSSKERKNLLPVHVVAEPDEVHRAVTVKTVFMAEQMTLVDERQIVTKTGHLIAREEVFDRVEAAIARQMEVYEK